MKLDELKKLALAATPGPWTVMAGDNYEIRSPLLPREYPHRCKEDSTGDFVAYIGNHAPDFGEANAKLISAATPQTILAMIELLREMGECLEYEVEILGFDAACARDALKKYREMTK